MPTGWLPNDTRRDCKSDYQNFEDQFEIEHPGLDDDLRELHEFDSIDAIELLREIEILLDTQLSREDKKAAMDIRTVNQIVDYVTGLEWKIGMGV